MGNWARDLRDRVVRALAMVGLVWAIALLAAVFMSQSAQGQHDDRGPESSATSQDAPRPAGLALALVVLASGVVVLAVGATGVKREPLPEVEVENDPDLGSDLPLALGLGLLA
jgi:hypothetical protein